MRVTINFKGEPGELLDQAREMSGIQNTSALCNEALRVYVELEKARPLNRFIKRSSRTRLPKRQ